MTSAEFTANFAYQPLPQRQCRQILPSHSASVLDIRLCEHDGITFQTCASGAHISAPPRCDGIGLTLHDVHVSIGIEFHNHEGIEFHNYIPRKEYAREALFSRDRAGGVTP